MIKCPNCGTNNNDGSNFCNNCGTSLQTKKEVYVYRDESNPNVKTFESPISPEMMMDAIKDDNSYSFDDWLDSITLERKWKILLKNIRDKAVWVGEKLVPIGQYIVKIISTIANNFSGMITGAIIGAIIGFLFSLIPLIGWVLGPILISAFAFTGAVAGLIKDLINKLPVEGQETIKKQVMRMCNAYCIGA